MYKHNIGQSITDTRVLFVRIQQTSGLEISTDVLQGVFGQCGTVQKILIFDKQNTAKCLVQMHSSQEAQTAIATLNGVNIYGDYCRITVFPSQFHEITLSRPYSLGVDYSNLHILTEPEQECVSEQEHGDEWAKQGVLHYMLDEQDSMINKSDSNSTACSQNQSQMRNTVRIEANGMAVKELYNIFSCLGNIHKIIKKTYYTYIAYSQNRFALHAKKHMSRIWQQHLLSPLVFAHSSQLRIKDNQYAETVSYSQQYHRYPEDVKIKDIGVPCSRVRIYYGGAIQDILRLLKAYGHIVRYELAQPHCLQVEFEDDASGILAVAQLHQHTVGTHHIYISFAY